MGTDTKKIFSMPQHQQVILSLAFALFLCFVLPPAHSFLAHNIFETGDPRLFPLFCVLCRLSRAACHLDHKHFNSAVGLHTGLENWISFWSERARGIFEYGPKLSLCYWNSK